MKKLIAVLLTILSLINCIAPIVPKVSAMENEEDAITPTQRNSLNMLNYITALTQEINDSKESRVFLESAYSALYNNTYPNAVDEKTQAEMLNILDTLDNFRMIAVKRERIAYIHEQNRAQAMRRAIPNPVALLSAVESGDMLRMAGSVLYMVVDSAASYSSATSQAETQFLQDGWELDSAEDGELHNSRKNMFNYMLNMVRDNDLPGDLALNEDAVKNFVLWKNNPNLIRKTAWFETNQETYKAFGPYWLELAKCYFDSKEYKQCLDAVSRYQTIATRIFRKDYDYAKILPMVIISAKETMSQAEYVKTASKYVDLILSNTDDSNWSLRYFAAQINLDLYGQTKDSKYLDKAYKITFDNVNVLVDEQRALNYAYVTPIQEAEVDKGLLKRQKDAKDAKKKDEIINNAVERQKDEAKQYKRLLKENRQTELPPVSEALYLNCDLLFALANERKIDNKEQNIIEAILHEDGAMLFLSDVLDSKFWFTKDNTLNENEIKVDFDGKKLILPVTCVTNGTNIVVTVSGENGTTSFEDWKVDEVERPKNADYFDYTAVLRSAAAKSCKYQAGDKITIEVTPVAEMPEVKIVFCYDVVAVKKAFIFNGIEFERKK